MRHSYYEFDNNSLSSMFGKTNLAFTRTMIIESGEVNGFFWADLLLVKLSRAIPKATIADLVKMPSILLQGHHGRCLRRRCAI